MLRPSKYNIIPQYPDLILNDLEVATPEPIPDPYHVSEQFRPYQKLISLGLTPFQESSWGATYEHLSDYYTPLLTTGVFGDVIRYLDSPFYIPIGGTDEAYIGMWNVLEVGAKGSSIVINTLPLNLWVYQAKIAFAHDFKQRRLRGFATTVFKAELQAAIDFHTAVLKIEVPFTNIESKEILEKIYTGTKTDYESMLVGVDKK